MKAPLVTFGEAIALGSSLFWGLGNLLVRRGQNASGESGMLLTTMVNSVLLGALLLAEGVVGLGRGHGFVGGITGGAGLRLVALGWFFAAGLLTTLMGRSLFFGAIRDIGPSRASSLKSTAPVFTAVVAVLAIAEPYSVRRGVGTVVVLAGLWLLNSEMGAMGGKRPAAPAVSEQAATRADSGGGTSGGDGNGGGGDRERGSDSGAGRLGVRMRSPAPRPLPRSDPLPAGGGAARPWLGSHRRGVALGLLGAASFGVGAVMRKVGLDMIPSPAFGAWISSTVAFVAVCVSARTGGRLSGTLRNYARGLWPFLLAGVCTTAAQLMAFTAYQASNVSLAAVLVALDPIFTVGLSRFVLRREEHITPRTVFAILLTLCGAATVLGS